MLFEFQKDVMYSDQSGLSAGVLMSALGLDQDPAAAGLHQRGEGLEADHPAIKSWIFT